MIGQTISHYKIIAKLGEGGMGVVYKAEDTKLKRIVALKFLPSSVITSEAEKSRFIHEAQAAAALNHPNICTIHEIDEADGQTFIAMEFIEGQSLKAKIEAGPLKLDEALGIAMQVAEGLQAAHEKQITHRDIKPANVMITLKGQVKIMDFGLAKLAGRSALTKEGTTLGTVAYMSPEQARGKEVDQRTDLWSLGVVLYEMLTGQLPFKGERDQAVIYSILDEKPEPVANLCSNVPAELEWIINKALAKKAGERYQHANEMLGDLKRLGKELETPGKKQWPKVVGRAIRKRALKRIVIPVGIALFLALGILLLRPLLFEQALVSELKPIAVISFENQTGDHAYDYLQQAIPNLLITSLEQSQYLRVTTWERMHDLLKQMGKTEVQIIDKDLGFELCRREGVEVIVVGSIVKAGEMFATDVKVLDVSSKNLLKSASAKGEGVASILKSQIDELGWEISRGLGLPEHEIEASQAPIAEVTTTSMEAYNYFLKGREYMDKAYGEDARRLLERAVMLDSTFAIAHFYLARLYGEYFGELQKRIEAFEKAKAYASRASERERLYIEARYAGETEQNPERAISILQQLVQKYPQDKRARLQLARCYYYTRQYDKAIEESNKVLELDPNFAPALNNLGYAYAKTGDFAKAIEYLKRYESAFPGDADPLDGMAEVYLQMGDVDAAIAYFKEAQAVKPDYYGTFKIAYCYALKEDYTEALKWLDKHRALFPNRPDAYYYMKVFYQYFQGCTPQAWHDLELAYQLADSIGDTRFKAEVERLKGWIYYDLGDFETGRIAIENAVNYFMENDLAMKLPLEAIGYAQTTRPFHKAYHSFYLGLVNVKLGGLDSAKQHLAVMKSLLPETKLDLEELTTIYCDLLHAEILLAEGSVEDAIVISQKIKPVQLPPMGIFLMFPYTLPFKEDISARAYQRQGNLDKAIAEYERLTTIDSKSQDRRMIPARFHYKLAKLYEQKGMTAKAAERYQRFLNLWQNADKDLPELIDAKKQLVKLRERR